MVLACGPGALLVDQSAGFLHQLLESPGPAICLAIPVGRKVIVPRGARVRRSRTTQPLGSGWPPRTGVDATVIDLAALGGPDEIAALIGRSIQAGLTTPGRLLRELARRGKHRQRGLVKEMLRDVKVGCESTLEVRFVKNCCDRMGSRWGRGSSPCRLSTRSCTAGEQTGRSS